jgi:hypothetical protein
VHPAFADPCQPQVRVTRGDGTLFPSGTKLIQQQWPYMGRSPGYYTLIEDVPEELKSCIGLRVGSLGTRQDFYLDPQHDFICVRWIRWKQKSGDWVKEWETQNGTLVQLPQGPWYAAKQVRINYIAPDGSMVTRETVWNIDVTVLREDEFPPDTFNGDKLLEGAQIETY